MHKGRRLISAFLAFAVLCTFLFSVFFIVAEADHKCTDDHCPICAAITVCRTFIGTLSVCAVLSVCTSLIHIFVRVMRARHNGSDRYTPVSLRVKLLN